MTVWPCASRTWSCWPERGIKIRGSFVLEWLQDSELSPAKGGCQLSQAPEHCSSLQPCPAPAMTPPWGQTCSCRSAAQRRRQRPAQRTSQPASQATTSHSGPTRSTSWAATPACWGASRARPHRAPSSWGSRPPTASPARPPPQRVRGMCTHRHAALQLGALMLVASPVQPLLSPVCYSFSTRYMAQCMHAYLIVR